MKIIKHFYAVRSSSCSLLPIFLPHNGHRRLYFMRVVYEQLCSFGRLLFKYAFSTTLLTYLVDGSRRSSSGHGFLELPSNNIMS